MVMIRSKIVFVAGLLIIFLISCEKESDLPSASGPTNHSMNMTVTPDTLVLSSTKSIRSIDATTVIDFNLPEGAHVRLVLYDDLDKLVVVLVDQDLGPGRYEVQWNAEDAASGVYYLKLTAGGYAQIRKLLLVK
jgi:hypothetical protein